MSIAEYKDEKFNSIIRKEIPDSVDQLTRSTFPYHIRVTDSVNHIARGKSQSHDVDKTADPRERYCRVYHPLMQVLLAPDGKNSLQVAFDRDEDDVGLGRKDHAPDKILAYDHHTEQISRQSSEIDIAKLNCIRDYQKQTAEEIEEILVEYQRVFSVLFRGDHGVEDQRVGRCSRQSDRDDCALEIKTDAVISLLLIRRRE